MAKVVDYLVWRIEIGDAAALVAAQQNVLLDSITGKMVDVVVLYSYGRATLSTLLESGFRGRVYLVRMEEEFRGPWVLHETDRIIEVLESNGIEHEEVSIGELPPWLFRLKHNEKTFACLIGTRCILADQPNRTFYGPIGVRSLALTVRDMDGRVVLVAEGDKVVEDALICDEYRKKQREVKPTSQPWTQVDVLEEAKHVDVVVVGQSIQ